MNRAATKPTAKPSSHRPGSSRWQPWLYLAPTLVFLLVFTYVAGFLAIQQGFGKLGSLATQENLNSLRVTGLYVLLSVPLAVGFGLIAALAVDGDSKLRHFSRAVLFHPVILPGIAFAAIWLYLLNPTSGPIALMLNRMTNGGISNPLGDPNSAFWAVLIIGVLKNFGLYMLYFLAGLQAVPKELTEAARVDGANNWQGFWRIIFPLLGPTTFYVGIVATMDALRNVDHVFLLTKGGPVGSTDLLLFRIYTTGFEYYDFARSGAYTAVMLVVLTALAIFGLPRIERGVHYAE